MNQDFRVALIWPPLSERFGYYRFGPRIPNLGIAYHAAFLEERGIFAEQINLDKKLHSESEIWRQIDQGGMLDDEGVIDEYMAGTHQDTDQDEAYEYLISCHDWKQYDVIGVGYEMQYLRDRYAPVFHRFLRFLAEECGVSLMVGGLGDPKVETLRYFKRFEFLDYVSFGTIDSLNLESLYKVILHERDGDQELSEVLNICYRDPGERRRVRMNRHDEYGKARAERDYILRPTFKLADRSEFRVSHKELLPFDPGFDSPGLAEAFAGAAEKVMIPYRFTINCVRNCAFCQLSAEGLRFSFKQPADVAEDFDKLMQENDSNWFIFLNAMIDFSKPYLEKLLNEMERRRLDIMFTDSAEVAGMDHESLQIIKEMGAVALWYGLECPSNRMLDMIGKSCTVEQAIETLQRSSDIGIWNGVNLIAGLPQETEEDFQCTVDFIRNNVDKVDMWQITPFYLVTSRFLERPEEYGMKIKSREVTVDKGEGYLTMATFDEINGPTWDERRARTTKGFGVLLDTIDEHASLPNLSNMGFLLYAYEHFGKGGKKQIQDLLRAHYRGTAPQIRRSGDDSPPEFWEGAGGH